MCVVVAAILLLLHDLRLLVVVSQLHDLLLFFELFVLLLQSINELPILFLPFHVFLFHFLELFEL